jgi:glycerol uptake facilitator-like aquaporin
MLGRRQLAVVLAEYIGTFVLATAMLAMLVRTNFEFFSAVAGAVVYGGFYLLFGSVSGSHLNPAVTLSHWTLRKISSIHAIIYIVVQLLAGLTAWKVGQYFLGQTLSKTATGGLDKRVLIAEAVGSLVFGLVIAHVALNKEFDTTKKAAILSLGLFASIVVASLASNGLLNPAVAIASRSISWAYIVGPIIGLVVGANLYNVIFVAKTATKTASSPVKTTVTANAPKRTVAKPKAKAKK